jgi:hypothetical protein
MIRKLTEYIGAYPKDLKILVYNVEFLDILYRMGIMWNNEIWFVNENPQQIQFARDIYVGDGNDKFICSEFLKIDKNMKFDVIVGNPPYQTKSEVSNTKTQALWHKFVTKSVELLKPEGYLCTVHPSGWRDIDGAFKSTQELLLSKNIQYLEMHNEKDGKHAFGVNTPYDWYILKNTDKKTITTIKGQDGKIQLVDLKGMKFIPNGVFDDIMCLVAKIGEPSIEIINNSSYHHQREEWMSRTRTEYFKHPCIYNIKADGLNLWYSSVNSKGHFGIPKVIFNSSANGGTSTFSDKLGEYGICEFCSGIVDSPENLENIKRALDSKKFLELMKYCKTGTALLNRKVISTFKKDFWKEFVDENGREI